MTENDTKSCTYMAAVVYVEAKSTQRTVNECVITNEPCIVPECDRQNCPRRAKWDAAESRLKRA